MLVNKQDQEWLELNLVQATNYCNATAEGQADDWYNYWSGRRDTLREVLEHLS